MSSSTQLGIVEDEALVAEDLRSLLDGLGYDVVFQLGSGEECLEAIRDHEVDLVIMDINLSGELDGIETARKLREERNVPTVYLTAYTDESTLRKATETDPLGYISKPVNETDLRTTLTLAFRQAEMERKIRSSEQRYRELIETSPDVIFRVNTDREFTFLSRNITQLGYEREELIGEDFTEILHSETRKSVTRDEVLPEYRGKTTGPERAPDLFDERRTGERATRNLEIKIRVGSREAKERYGTEYPTFEVNSAGVFRRRDEEQEPVHVGSVGIIRDVMPRKEAEKELRLKERAMSSAREGITIADAEGEDNPLIYVNEGFLEMTGYDRNWVLGRDCRFLQGEETDPAKVAEMRRAIEEEEPITVELVNYRRDGEPFWNQVSITPIRNEEGTVSHFVGIQQDVTEQKQRHDELRQAEKLAAIGEMSAGLMHEINNPNAFIQGNLQYLRKAWETIREELPDTVGENRTVRSVLEELDGTLKDMRRGTERIEEIVNNVKLFSRRNRMSDELQKFNPLPVVREALKTLEAPGDGLVSVRLHDRDTVGNVQGDPTELNQVVTNLVSNAIDAVQDTESPEVIVEARFDDDTFHLVVQDNGCGIPEDRCSKIFDPFYTTKPTGEGTGLGLSIVQGIVERSGGNIKVDSTEGTGTRFEVLLPRAEPTSGTVTAD